MQFFMKTEKDDKKKLEKEKKAERDEMQKTYREVSLKRAMEMKKLNKSVRKSRDSEANEEAEATTELQPTINITQPSPTSQSTTAGGEPSPQTPPQASAKRKLKVSTTPDSLTEFGVKLDEIVCQFIS